MPENMEVRTVYNDCMRKKRNEMKEKENEDIEKICEQKKRAYSNSAEEIQGYGKGNIKPWISEDT